MAVLVLLLGLDAGMAWIGIVAAVFVVLECAAVVRRGALPRLSILFLWGSTLVALASPFVFRRSVQIVENSLVWMGCVIALALAIATTRLPRHERRPCKVLGFVWAGCSTTAWIAVAYVRNEPVRFHVGLVLSVALIVLLKRGFNLRTVGIQAANTVLLLIVLLPVVDWVHRPRYVLNTRPDTRARYFSYENARRDPVAFARWWKYFFGQWCALADQIDVPDPAGVLPFRLRPHCRVPFFQSTICINSNGFRGAEIAVPKPDVYRIVILGESTTFGCTLNPEDRPWPEWLQDMINRRIHGSRPVEVINAGVAAYTLEDNVKRLSTDILPLKPDMIISYHGINGFAWFDPSLPPVRARRPPRFRERPLRLLADAEYHLRLLIYQATLRANSRVPGGSAVHPMDTQYAREYEQLIHIARTNNIRLALANFSMAVNGDSDRDVIEFYRGGFPTVYRLIAANQLHNELVGELAAEHPEIVCVNTHPGLDGRHEQFVDLVHFTESGRKQLAENIFAGIRPLLEKELQSGNDVGQGRRTPASMESVKGSNK